MAFFPKRLIHGLHFNNIRGDIFGGLTAAIVALPLALAFGVSSGVGAINGLYGAIAIGFFAALFGGTPSQVSGPTGPMTVVMATVVTAMQADYDNGLAMAFTAVMLGGALQILFGLLRLGKYITLIPYTVISGFMSGIGVIIICIELGPLFGHEGLGVVDSIQHLPQFIGNPNPAALGLSILTLTIVFGFPRRLNNILPAPLVALVAGTLASAFLPTDALDRIGSIPTGLPEFQLPVFAVGELKTIMGYGLMLAVLGAIDSLLTSLVADNLTQTQHDSDRELIGQGLGNLFSGLIGGLPGAGATMRTVINVKAGGQTPLSGMIHALVLLMIAFGAGKLTEAIPLAVLAAILVKVGIDIIDWSFIKRAHRVSGRATGLMYGVLLLTVFVDLITAVGVGVFIANIFTVKSLTEVQIEGMRTISNGNEASVLSPEEQRLFHQAQGRILLFNLGGPMSFGAAKAISQRLAVISQYDVLILELSDVPRLGVTASLAIENMVKESKERNRQVFLVGVHGRVKDRLNRLQVFDLIPPENSVSTRLEALQRANDSMNVAETVYENA